MAIDARGHRRRAALSFVTVLATAIIAAALSAGVSTAIPPREDDNEEEKARAAEIADGEFLYRLYCRSCHGETAEGDGPVAGELRTPPADLTRIRSRNDGDFPSQKIHRRIDGRTYVGAHGPGDMPVWGVAFQQPGADTNQEDDVRGKIRRIVSYLESIQIVEEP